MASKFITAIAILLLACAAHADESKKASATSGLYLVEFTLGPNWAVDTPPQEQNGFADHSANLARMRKAGLVLFGARYGDKGVVLLKVPDEATARQALAEDPTIAAGVFNAAIHEFRPFYTGEVPASGHTPDATE